MIECRAKKCKVGNEELENSSSDEENVKSLENIIKRIGNKEKIVRIINKVFGEMESNREERNKDYMSKERVKQKSILKENNCNKENIDTNRPFLGTKKR